MTIPFPEDEHLALIGRLAYAVTYLEGAAICDLLRHAAVLPAELSVEALAGKGTGEIAGANARRRWAPAARTSSWSPMAFRSVCSARWASWPASAHPRGR